MSVIQKSSNGAFDAEKTRAICQAFDDAWSKLTEADDPLVGSIIAPSTRTILARRILELADQGISDVASLCDEALRHVNTPPPKGGGFKVTA
jgi:hypothetical protein